MAAATKKATKKKTTLKLGAEARLRIERQAARMVEERQREERLLWGMSAAMSLAIGVGSDEAATAADAIIAEWKKRYS